MLLFCILEVKLFYNCIQWKFNSHGIGFGVITYYIVYVIIAITIDTAARKIRSECHPLIPMLFFAFTTSFLDPQK